MDIAGIWNSLRSVTPFDAKGRSEPSEAVVSPPAESRAGALSPKSQAALQDILSRHDVTNITPRGFTQLLDELHTTGVIQHADYEELALLRLELDQQGIGPDEPVDLLDILKQKLESQERESQKLAEQGKSTSAPPDINATLRQMDWIQKLALIHRSGEYQPLDLAV